MPKSYTDYQKEISPEKLYHGLLAHGFFPEKLPSFLSAEYFFDYCQSVPRPLADKPRSYIYYESMRNTNVPRQLGIPNPVAYQRLCLCLKENWYNLWQHFEDKTINQAYKVSRVHIRRLKDKQCLFEMNYDNWKIDGSPEPNLMIGKRYLVKADISNCFPSIYTHAIPWALVGKDTAKMNKTKKLEWYNQIDHYSQNIKYGETHGLIIGPHTSNLLSEIILTAIDYELCEKKWEYIRKIDDYLCYVSKYDDARKFLVDLNEQLRFFDLSLNQKKTEILELPLAAVEQWVRQINVPIINFENSSVNYKTARSYFDSAVELMYANDMNSAVLKYAIKVLSNQKLTENAKIYCTKTIMHFTVIFPYLLPLIDEFVFTRYSVPAKDIEVFTNLILETGILTANYEMVSYSIFFAIKYNFKLMNFALDDVIKGNNCIAILLTYLYVKKQSDQHSIKILKDYARQFINTDGDFEKNWLFAYEILPKSNLKEEWKNMKQAGVSFIKNDIRNTCGIK